MRFKTDNFGNLGRMNGVVIGKGNFGDIMFNKGDFGSVDQGSYSSNKTVSDALQSQLNSLYAVPTYTSSVSTDLQKQYNSLMNTAVAPGTKITFPSGLSTSPITNFIKSPAGIVVLLLILGATAFLVVKPHRTNP